MTDIIDKKTGVISLTELSKFNGKSEMENLKMLTLFLAQKAEFYGIPQKMHITCKGNKAEGV